MMQQHKYSSVSIECGVMLNLDFPDGRQRDFEPTLVWDFDCFVDILPLIENALECILECMLEINWLFLGKIVIGCAANGVVIVSRLHAHKLDEWGSGCQTCMAGEPCCRRLGLGQQASFGGDLWRLKLANAMHQTWAALCFCSKDLGM